jgi:putative transposase
MPDQKADPLTLSAETKEALEKLIKGYTTRQQIAKRARLIKLVAIGKNDQEIAQAIGVNRHTVRHWRTRWLRLEAIPLSELSVEERLEDLPRPGTPLRITAEQRCQIEALACSAPEKSGRPISQWTGREIADEIIQQKIVTTISARHAARLLKRSLHSPSSEPLLVKWSQR